MAGYLLSVGIVLAVLAGWVLIQRWSGGGRERVAGCLRGDGSRCTCGTGPRECEYEDAGDIGRENS